MRAGDDDLAQAPNDSFDAEKRAMGAPAADWVLDI
jgi:hypothetical protein